MYRPGSLKAVGYVNGRRKCVEQVFTAGAPAQLSVSADRVRLKADSRDLSVLDISVLDSKGHFAPTACVPVTVTVDGPVRILGAGNGGPAFRGRERPLDPSARSFTIDSFNGHAQFLIQATGQPGTAVVRFGPIPCEEPVCITVVK